MKLRHTLGLMVVLAGSAGIALAQQGERGQAVQGPAVEPALATPSSIRTEHEHLHHELELAITSGGKTAESAKAVAAVLMPHFKAEEEYAMPPLGLLPALAHDQPLTSEQIRGAIQMSDQLRFHHVQMIREHRQIHSALESLASSAREEHKTQALAFAEVLMLHAQNEEQVLYPATLLIGKYLTLIQTAGRRNNSPKLMPSTKH